MKARKRYIFNSCAMLMLLLAVVLSSCKDDDGKFSGDPYFSIEGDWSSISVTNEAKNQKFTVRSNRPWKVVAQDKYSWVKAFPNEGEDDGIFEIRVSANKTIRERFADFSFVVDGKEQPILFHVEQEASAPTLIVTPAALVTVPNVGGEVKIAINANIGWSYTLGDDTWLTNPISTSDSLKFTASRNNTGSPRETTLTFTPNDAQYIDSTRVLIIKQASERIDDGKAVGFEYFADDFSWVSVYAGPADIENYNSAGNATVTGTFNMYSKTIAGEGGYPAGTLKNDFISHGYTDINAAKESVYFALHYLKFGKTDVQSGIQRTIPNTDLEKVTNITLTFDATPCITGSKNFDKVFMQVEISGPGSVGVSDDVTKVSEPINIQLVDKDPVWSWKPCSVVLYGVNASTQVTIRTDKTGTDTGVFRYYLDNLKFVKHSIVSPE